MEKECPYARYDGQPPWTSKRQWDMVDCTQGGPADLWEDQGKRLCLPGSFGNTDFQMQMTSDTPTLVSNLASEPPGYVESSVDFSGLPETSDLLWINDGSGASQANLLLSPDLWGDCFVQSTSYFTSQSGIVNSSENCGPLKGL